MRTAPSAGGQEQLLVSLNELANQYRRAISEAGFVTDLVVTEINWLLAEVERHGDAKLHAALRQRIESLPSRMRLASAPGPSDARH
jgi:hypothetical protein